MAKSKYSFYCMITTTSPPFAKPYTSTPTHKACGKTSLPTLPPCFTKPMKPVKNTPRPKAHYWQHGYAVVHMPMSAVVAMTTSPCITTLPPTPTYSPYLMAQAVPHSHAWVHNLPFNTPSTPCSSCSTTLINRSTNYPTSPIPTP